MKLKILNRIDAENYVSEIVGDSVEDYGFTAALSVRAEEPETAYETVNQSAVLEIDGISKLGVEFDEHQFSLDVMKSDYVNELEDLTKAHETLQKNGFEYATEISAQEEGKTPGEAMSNLEDSPIKPVMREEDSRYNSVILYNPDDTPVFQPRVQPKETTNSREAIEREEELENVLRALNIE